MNYKNFHLPYKIQIKDNIKINTGYTGDKVEHVYTLGGDINNKIDFAMTVYKDGTIIGIDMNHSIFYTNNKEVHSFVQSQNK